MLTWVLVGVGVLAGLVLLAVVIGLCLPRSHVVTRGMNSGQTPEAVWAVITDYAGVTSWHPQVKVAERLPDRDGREVWRETYQGCPPLTLVTLEASAPRRLVRSISDDKGPFTGRWEYEIEPAQDGSRITITEYGKIANPVVRLMARLFMDPAMYLEMYLKALAGKFGEEPIIETGAEPRGSAGPNPVPKGA